MRIGVALAAGSPACADSSAALIHRRRGSQCFVRAPFADYFAVRPHHRLTWRMVWTCETGGSRDQRAQGGRMNILDAVLGAHGGGAAQQLGQQFGLNETQVSSALSALVPALAAGFQQNMSSPQGLDGLLSALGSGQHQRYVDDSSALAHPDTVADGNGILGHILGSKDVSRQVASRAAAQTGIGEGVLKSMLPVVAAMMMGTMSKQVAPAGTSQAGVAAGGDALLGMLTPMLDSNRDGSMIDDVIGMLGRLTGRR